MNEIQQKTEIPQATGATPVAQTPPTQQSTAASSPVTAQESQQVSQPSPEEKTVVKKVEKKKNSKQTPGLNRSDGGINLIPPQTESEKKTEQRKFTLNLSAAYTLLFLVVLSILIIGFNAYQKITLNSSKERLFQLEKDLNLRVDLLGYNDEIVRRVKLYESIEETEFSSKEVVDYWETISQGIGQINTIELSAGLAFEVTGSAGSLSDVSRLWYLLASDRHIETVNLENVVRDGSTARFTFEGTLNFSEFVKPG